MQCVKIRTNNNNNQPWTKQNRNKAWNIKCKKGKEYIKSNNDNNNNNQPWTTTKKTGTKTKQGISNVTKAKKMKTIIIYKKGKKWKT